MATVSLEERREQATQIGREIAEQKASLSSILKDASGLLAQIDKKDKSYNALNQKLQAIQKETITAVKNFNLDKAKILKLLSEAEKFYTQKYLPLQAKINSKESGFAVKIQSANKEYREFVKIKENCKKTYDEIVELGRNYKSKTTELAKIEVSIKKLHNSAEQNKNRIDKLYEATEKAYKEITVWNKNIYNLNQESKSLTQKIIQYERESQSNNDNINQLYADSQKKLAEIRNIYEIAHETGLGGEFEKRRNNLNHDISKWEKQIKWTSLGLFLGIIALFVCQLGMNHWVLNETFDLNFYIRFLVFSPVVYYLYFISTQYNKAKKLHDKYAFKTTLSMAIKSHIDLLTKQGYFVDPEHFNRILDFVLDGFRNIYNEPHDSDNYKMKIKLANIEIDMQKKIIDKLSAVSCNEELIKSLVSSLKEK